jgi:hypothetical protein
MFLGITHKVKLEWQLIIALYFGHIQGELKSSLNFKELFSIIVASQEPLLFGIEGTLGKNQFLHSLKMFRIFAIFSKWVPHYHLGEGILGWYH